MTQLAGWLELEPLIGVSAASRLIGIPPSNFKRDVASRLTHVPVAGSATVYFRSEIEQFAAEKQGRAKSNGHEQPAEVSQVRSSEDAKAGVAPIPKGV